MLQVKSDAFEGAGAEDSHGDTSGEEKFNRLLEKFSVSPWLADPRSKRMKNWDGLVALALVYTATVTPYEVAFLDTKPGGDLDTSLSAFPVYVVNM